MGEFIAEASHEVKHGIPPETGVLERAWHRGIGTCIPADIASVAITQPRATLHQSWGAVRTLPTRGCRSVACRTDCDARYQGRRRFPSRRIGAPERLFAYTSHGILHQRRNRGLLLGPHASAEADQEPGMARAVPRPQGRAPQLRRRCGERTRVLPFGL